ncbi:zinc finger protein 184-like [Haliotis rufescens]|uniref:zinc finger protein 184-like n=1 Tax=Haliotis rufescens TaxID=6454 RepID=UPI00201EBCDB|nr:zinc finger protein 184-like [Haliotis rufescens]
MKGKGQGHIAKEGNSREDIAIASSKPQTSDNFYCLDSKQLLVFPKAPVMKHVYPQIALNKTLMNLDTSVLPDIAKHVLNVPFGMTDKSKQKDEIQPEAVTAAVCPKLLSQQMTLKKQKPYECKVCNKHFANSDSHRYHMKTHMDQLHWFDICDKWYKLASDLNRHKLALHPIPSDKESSCSDIEDEEQNIEVENEVVDAQEIEDLYESDDVAGDGVHDAGSAEVDTETDEGQLSRGNVIPGNGTSRKLTTPARPSTQVMCNLCGKFFESHESKSHYSEHMGGDVYKCSKCHQRFNLFPDLSKHSKTCKESLEHLKAFSCSFCNKQFDKQDHIKTHNGTEEERSEAQNIQCYQGEVTSACKG